MFLRCFDSARYRQACKRLLTILTVTSVFRANAVPKPRFYALRRLSPFNKKMTMSQDTRLLFQETPGLFSQYSRALFARGNNDKSSTLPDLEAWLSDVRIRPDDVRDYAKVCGFASDGTVLPLTYPHILAFPLHMELMLHARFPLAVMGLVHIRNEITQHRAIRLDEVLNIRCSFGTMRKTDKGLEFDIRTEISSLGEIVWESVSTNLSRKGSSKGSKNQSPRPQPIAYQQQQSWNLASNLGRRYARVSGDSNPIHLFSLSARLFGFPGHIAHGMWSKARAAATLHPLLGNEQCVLSTEFKLPVFLPGQVNLDWSASASGLEFELRNRTGDKTHMKGSIKALNQV